MRARLPRTLRGRLVAVLTLMLMAAFAAAVVVTVLAVRQVLTDRLDGQLRAAGTRFAVGLERDDGDADNRFGEVEGQAAGTLAARIDDGRVTDAAVVARRDTADAVSRAARTQLARLDPDGVPRTVRLAGLGDYRVVVVPGRDGDRLVTGLPAEPVEETIEKLLGIETAVFVGTLLVVVVSAAGLVRWMLRPLARMAATAGDVSSLPLHRGGVTLPEAVPARTRGSEVDALAVAFNRMLAEVGTALATRDAGEERLRRFVADASHELRTPVAVVRSHADLARLAAERSADPVPDQVTHSLDRITAQADRMGRLVEDLLLLARLDAGRPLAREPVDLVRVVLEAVEDVRVTAPDHRWRLDLPEAEVLVDGDAHGLAQVAANLLANAALHTPAGTTVTTSVTTSVTMSVAVEDAAVRLVVTDDGPGMGDGVAATAFDRFVRGRATAGGSGGLGLPIVAAIVAAHGGEVDLTSGRGGTRIALTFPAAGAGSTVPSAEPSPPPGGP